MKKKLCSEFNCCQYMQDKNFELYYYSNLHFSSVEEHSHAYTEVYLFCEGAVDMYINGTCHTLHTGDVLVLPAGTVHRALVRNGAEAYRRFVFWLSDDFCDTLRQEAEEYLYVFDQTRESGCYVYPMESLVYNSLRSKLTAILEELNSDSFGRDAKISLGVRELLLSLSREIHRRVNRSSKKEQYSSYQIITDYISEHLEEDLSLDALSERFFLNKFYIAHLVQENAGISLHKFITKKRLSACVNAMENGQSIVGCYTRFGFLNYSGFYRAFLKEYGCSPGAFRKERLYITSSEHVDDKR